MGQTDPTIKVAEKSRKPDDALPSAHQDLRQQLQAAHNEIARLQDQITTKEEELASTREALAAKEATLYDVLNSKGWRLLNKFRAVKFRLAQNEQAQFAMRVLARRRRLTISNRDYRKWIELHEGAGAEQGNVAYEQLAYEPLISIVMPVYNTPLELLQKAIESVRKQSYHNWELCIHDDSSTRAHIRSYLEQQGRDEPRIKLSYGERNQGIGAASNHALQLARGEFVGLLDHDDELAPSALYEVAKLLQEHPQADVIYSDEDKLDRKGRRCDPFFKPDWSPEYLLSCNYISHFGVYRKHWADAVGGFRPGLEGSQDYDLLLRITEHTQNIFHIPKILYHWRKVHGSTASLASAKSYSTDAGQKALQEHLQRRGLAGRASSQKQPNRYRARPKIQGSPRVSIIVPTKDGVPVLKRCLESIEQKSTYQNYEIVIVDNNSAKPETASYFKTLQYQVIPLPEPFNFSRINNFAAQHTNAPYLLFLNNDTEVISPEWLETMLELCQMPGIGIVGAKLYYPNHCIQHAGVVLGVGGVAGHSHKYFPRRNRGYFDSLICIRNYSAVTAACMMVKREAFEAVGGFDEQIRVAFNDVDFCLRVRDKGYRVVWTPFAELFHYESVSRGYVLDAREIEFMKKRWGKALLEDPYYSPNLTLKNENFGIRLIEGEQK